MKNEFYILSFNSNNIELFMEVDGEYDYMKLHVGVEIPSKLKLLKSQGRKAYDIVRLQDVYNFLISGKLKVALEEANLTGWKTYNVETNGVLNDYYGFQCYGKCGSPNRPTQTGFITGFKFDIKTWDGSDFFIPDSTMMIICTEKAKQVIDEFKIKNIEINSLKNYEWYNV